MVFKILLFSTLALVSISLCQKNKLDKCKNRRVDFEIYDKKYFFNGYIDDINQPVTWPEARAACKSYCTDLISVDLEEEFVVMRELMLQLGVDYFWTAGHVCEKEECDKNSYPININGWRWVDSSKRIPPTNVTPPGWSFNPWSQTGYRKVPQPDNAELGVTATNESCLAILHNVYNDGVKFHDVACYHAKDFICEYYADED